MAQRFRVLFLALLVLPAAASAGLSESYGRLPLHFEENRGQVHKDVRFLARGPGYGLYFTAGEAVLALGAKDRTVLRMALVGANAKAPVSGLEELPGKANYFVGKDPAKWRTNVPTYAKVHYQNVYPGVDLVYYGNQRQLEYDFVVAPGADPKRIGLRFEGANKLEIDAGGDLVLRVAQGDVRVKKPVVYQDIGAKRHKIDGRYVLTNANRVGFQLAPYDTSKALVIDPVLAYSTYLGPGRGAGIAVDSAGSAYVAGTTSSADFPSTVGSFRPTSSGGNDVFVAKLNSAGSALVYSTYLGGSAHETAQDIAVDTFGNAYVIGSTNSTDFPTSPGTSQSASGGGVDGFLAKLNPAGSELLYASYLGGNDYDEAWDIALDSRNVYVTGRTRSPNFPTSAGAFQTTFSGGFDPECSCVGPDVFVAKFGAASMALMYSTYIGGTRSDYSFGIAADEAGNAYVTGATNSTSFPVTPGAFLTPNAPVFVTKLNPAGSALVYSSRFGGRLFQDEGYAIAVDADGNAFVTGFTRNSDFPTTPGAFRTSLPPGDLHNGFVIKLNSTGSLPVYSTYLGGTDVDLGKGIAVDSLGNAYIVGDTYSANFPTTPDAFQRNLNGFSDAFVTKLNPAGSALVYSSYLGVSDIDSGDAISLDSAGNAYITGYSPSFPTTTGAFRQTANGGLHAYVAKLDFSSIRAEEDSVAYTGYWQPYGSETGTFSGGTIRASNQATATATFTFTGTAVSWIGVKCNVCGIASVQIDGGAPTVVDTFGPGEPGSLTSEPVFTASGLAPGATHTLTIVVTGGGAAVPGLLTGSAHVAVDAFDVTQ